MNKIYIVMVNLPTFINHIVYCITGFKHNHFSISFDKSLKEMYSFDIKNKNYTLLGGLTKEDDSFYFRGKNDKILEEYIYEIEVNDEDYNQINNYIKNIKKDDEYTFNYLSSLFMFLIGGLKSYKSYHCSEFISEVLNLIEEIELPKKTYKMHPKDLYKVLNKYKHTKRKIYSKDYKIDNNNVFFRKIKLHIAIKKSLYSIKESFCRAIFQRTSKNFDYHNINFYDDDCK